MTKLFSEKLNNLEKSLETINELDKRLTDCETKIKQLIDEITPILNSHANALKELSSVIATMNQKGSMTQMRRSYE